MQEDETITPVSKTRRKKEMHDLQALGERLTELNRTQLDSLSLPESLLDAANFMHTVEKRQGLKIAVPEEVAWRMGYIDVAQVKSLAAAYKNNDYGRYLLKMLEQG